MDVSERSQRAPRQNGPVSTPIYQSATFQAASVVEQERVGIEAVEDLMADIDQALVKTATARPVRSVAV
jgi:cystathionine beta-lyase/cystathionine gamma-synthase